MAARIAHEADVNARFTGRRCGLLWTKMGEKFEVLVTNRMGDDMFIATPAVADKSLYLRGKNTLYCVRGTTN